MCPSQNYGVTPQSPLRPRARYNMLRCHPEWGRNWHGLWRIMPFLCAGCYIFEILNAECTYYFQVPLRNHVTPAEGAPRGFGIVFNIYMYNVLMTRRKSGRGARFGARFDANGRPGSRLLTLFWGGVFAHAGVFLQNV